MPRLRALSGRAKSLCSTVSHVWTATSMVVELVVTEPPNYPLQPTVGGLGGDRPPRWTLAHRG
jgi:hypothetical protein